MGRKYKFHNREGLYFVSLAMVYWLEETEYYYTLQGWLKSINNPNEGNSTFAQTFQYFDNDYQRGGVTLPEINVANGGQQYNGMITAIKYKTRYGSGTTEDEMHYSYDDRYQLLGADNDSDNKFKVDNLVYDANGNIQSVRRKNETAANLHDLNYNYLPNKLNQLESVDDQVTNAQYASYTYNKIGEMETLNRQGGPIQTFEYDVTGKVKSITSTSQRLEYEYDDRGFRIRKIDDQVSSHGGEVFVRDASGSILAVYQMGNDGSATATEHPVYGASRLGTHYANTSDIHYELKDHLGNVRAIVKDAGTTSMVPDQDIYTFDDGKGFINGYGYFISEQSHLSGYSYSGDNAWLIPEQESEKIEFEVKGGEVVSIELWTMTRNGSELSTRLYFSEDLSNLTSISTLNNTASDLTWQKLTHPDYTATQDGWIRLYVDSDINGSIVDDIVISISRERKDAEVITQSNYYPYGLKMIYTGLNIGPAGDYRYGYQGEFSEEDDETGFNHFEARQYDAVIGRWMVTDPASQYFSPYLSMDNNPIMGVDPDGEWVYYWQFGVGFSLGAWFGYGAELKVGVARDDFGRVHFEMQSYLTPETAKEGEFVFGAALGGSSGVGLNRSASFIDILDQYSLTFDYKLPYGGSIDFLDQGLAGNIGIGIGGSVSSIKDDVVKFLAFTPAEIRAATGYKLDSNIDLYTIRTDEDGRMFLNFSTSTIGVPKWYYSDIEVLPVPGYEGGFQTAGYKANRENGTE